MKQIDRSLDGGSLDALRRIIGEEFVSYHSDMDTPDRAYSVVVLRFGHADVELRVREIESQEEWIADTTTTSLAEVSLAAVHPPAGKVDEQGNYVPNKFIAYPVGGVVKHVSIINETTSLKQSDVVSCELTTTRGFIIETDAGFVAFDKTEPFGEVWTITSGSKETYCSEFRESDDESPEFTTRVEVIHVA